jgi:preprotein translocase subunit SecA
VQDPSADGPAVPSALRGVGVGGPANTSALRYSGPAEDGTESRSGGQAGGAASGSVEPARNQPCPCGSGRKYKHCHGTRTSARG